MIKLCKSPKLEFIIIEEEFRLGKLLNNFLALIFQLFRFHSFCTKPTINVQCICTGNAYVHLNPWSFDLFITVLSELAKSMYTTLDPFRKCKFSITQNVLTLSLVIFWLIIFGLEN